MKVTNKRAIIQDRDFFRLPFLYQEQYNFITTTLLLYNDSDMNSS